MLSIMLASIMIISHLWEPAKPFVIGTKYEGIIACMSLLFSTILVAIITAPGHGLAVDNEGAIAFGNMYFITWLGFFNMVFISQNLVGTLTGINLMESMNSTLFSWVLLFASSMMVMGSSSELHGMKCGGGGGGDIPQPFCSRSILGVSVGVIGTLFSGGIVAMKILNIAAPFLVEAALIFWLFIMYIFEVAFVTGHRGPGAPLGNLFFFSWISLLLTIVIGNSCHVDYVAAQQPHEQVATTEMPTLAQIPVGDDDRDLALGVEEEDGGVDTHESDGSAIASPPGSKEKEVDEHDII